MVSSKFNKEVVILIMSLRHEHLYKKIGKDNILVSDRFSSQGAFQKALQGTQVILCTLSMISNPKLQFIGTQVVPVINVIIDEASQIEVGQYVPLFKSFGKILRKICFVGDDKQCQLLLHCSARNSTFLSAAARSG
jgi:regulator of nonsense transcripts 1